MADLLFDSNVFSVENVGVPKMIQFIRQTSGMTLKWRSDSTHCPRLAVYLCTK